MRWTWSCARGWAVAAVLLAGMTAVTEVAAQSVQRPTEPAHEYAGHGRLELPSTVEVAATGTFDAEPDEVDVSWQITGREASLKAAYASTQQQAARVRALLGQQGFTPEQVHWSRYHVQPDLDYKTQKVTGYTVTVEAQLKFTDFQKIGPLLDAAGSSGLNALQGVSFALKDQQAARAAAIADGYRQTQSEAEALAAAAGRKLAGLSRATVDVSSPIEPRRFGAVAMAARSAPAPTEGFSPERITVSARVTAVFRLAP